jgi:hypothetical protein
MIVSPWAVAAAFWPVAMRISPRWSRASASRSEPRFAYAASAIGAKKVTESVFPASCRVMILLKSMSACWRGVIVDRSIADAGPGPGAGAPTPLLLPTVITITTRSPSTAMPARYQAARSPRGVGCADALRRRPPPATGVPHSPQNFARGGFLAPHLLQVVSPSGAPHSEQNLPEVCAPHEGHFWVGGIGGT